MEETGSSTSSDRKTSFAIWELERKYLQLKTDRNVAITQCKICKTTHFIRDFTNDGTQTIWYVDCLDCVLSKLRGRARDLRDKSGSSS